MQDEPQTTDRAPARAGSGAVAAEEANTAPTPAARRHRRRAVSLAVGLTLCCAIGVLLALDLMVSVSTRGAVADHLEGVEPVPVA